MSPLHLSNEIKSCRVRPRSMFKMLYNNTQISSKATLLQAACMPGYQEYCGQMRCNVVCLSNSELHLLVQSRCLGHVGFPFSCLYDEIFENVTKHSVFKLQTQQTANYPAHWERKKNKPSVDPPLYLPSFICVCSGVTLSWGTQRCRRSLSPSPRSLTCQDTREAAAPESRSPKDWRRFTLHSNKAWSE